jgi:hypothetical protein
MKSLFHGCVVGLKNGRSVIFKELHHVKAEIIIFYATSQSSGSHGIVWAYVPVAEKKAIYGFYVFFGNNCLRPIQWIFFEISDAFGYGPAKTKSFGICMQRADVNVVPLTQEHLSDFWKGHAFFYVMFGKELGSKQICVVWLFLHVIFSLYGMVKKANLIFLEIHHTRYYNDKSFEVNKKPCARQGFLLPVYCT